jgi:hypothetical protein
MHFGRFPRKTLLAATLLLAFSAANASFLEQSGTAPTPPAAMDTYGVDVATRVGLKAVIPSGWKLFVHRSVELPESLSWKVGESWVSVLNNFAKANDIAILVDWDKKSVYFRTTSLALQEQEKRQMITQAAATPLPSFKTGEKAPVVAKPAEPVAAAPVLASAESKPVPAVAPTSPEVRVAAATGSAPTIASVEPAKTIAAKIEPIVSTAGATAATTAMAVGAAEPVPPLASGMTLAAKAPVNSRVAPEASLGLTESLVAAANEPFVAPKSTSKAVALDTTTATTKVAVSPASAQTKPAEVLLMKSAPEPAPIAVATAPAVAPVSTPTTPMFAAQVAAPQPAVAIAAPSTYAEQPLPTHTAAEAFNRKAVDQVIRAAADKHGYVISWEAADVQFPGPVTILGADMGEDMKLVLRALGGRRSPVSIDVYRASNVVRVRNASGTAEVAFMDGAYTGAIREKSVATFTVKVREEAAALPTLVAAPAPMPHVVATGPVAVVPEPARVDTAVPTVKKLEPAARAEVPAETSLAPVVTLRVEKGDTLRPAIESLLEPGWSLKWDVNGEMEANTRLEASGVSLIAVLNDVLPRMALSADAYKPSKLIVIRPADPALDK